MKATNTDPCHKCGNPSTRLAPGFAIRLLCDDCNPPNRTNLPPTRSAEEYEAEIERLVRERSEAWSSAYTIGYADKACGEKLGHTPNPFIRAATETP